MNGSLILVFVMVWWVVIFMLLPFGIEQDMKPDEGHDHGAPKKPRIRLKIVLTTVIALFLTLTYGFLLQHGYLDGLSIRPQQ